MAARRAGGYPVRAESSQQYAMAPATPGAYAQGSPGYAGPPSAAYSEGYPPGYAYGTRTVEDPAVVAARSTHKKGSVLYAVAWVVLGLGLVLLAGGLGLILSAILGGGSVSSQAGDLFVASIALIGGGMAVRGVGFSLMMKADFLLRSRMAPDVPG